MHSAPNPLQISDRHYVTYFADVVIADENGNIITAKSPSTPEDYPNRIFNALQNFAAQLDLNVEQLCAIFARFPVF